MKTFFLLLIISFPAFAASQVISEEQLILMVESAQEKCIGAHENVVMATNEGFAKAIWGQTVRINEAKTIKFFTHPSGEKASGGFDVFMNNKGALGYSYDPKTTTDLLLGNGVRVTQSYNQPWISARQDLLYATNIKEEHTFIMELYCPHQSFLETLRIGQVQSIEFFITGFSGSSSKDSKIYGVLTQVNLEKLSITCSNGHEFDKATGYKFCPECGEPLE